jgi:hypothetical protein
MDDYTCACGFGSVSAEELGDHVGEMVIPPDDTAPDGQLHAEAARDAASPAGCRCVCGFRSDSMTGVDEHLLGVFAGSGAIGRDGRRHALPGQLGWRGGHQAEWREPGMKFRAVQPSGEHIRAALIRQGVLKSVITLPSGMTAVPGAATIQPDACLWVLQRPHASDLSSWRPSSDRTSRPSRSPIRWALSTGTICAAVASPGCRWRSSDGMAMRSATLSNLTQHCRRWPELVQK